MNKIEQYQAHMRTFALAMAQAAAAFSKMAQVVGEMAEAIDESGARDLPFEDDASASHDPAAHEPTNSVRKTDPARPPVDAHVFGKALRQARRTAGKNLEEVSDHIGVPIPTVSDVELGRRMPLARDEIEAVAELFGTRPDALLAAAGLEPHDTEPAPRPCENHELGSCSCDGPVTGPHFPAPATREPNTAYSDMMPKSPAPPCRVSITAGAHTGRRGTVMAAIRGKKLRVNIDETGRTDDVLAVDVTLLEGSAPLPVYTPKSKA